MRTMQLAAIAALTVLSSSAFAASSVPRPTCVPVVTNAADPDYAAHAAANARCSAAVVAYAFLGHCEAYRKAKAHLGASAGSPANKGSTSWNVAECDKGEPAALAQLAAGNPAPVLASGN